EVLRHQHALAVIGAGVAVLPDLESEAQAAEQADRDGAQQRESDQQLDQREAGFAGIFGRMAPHRAGSRTPRRSVDSATDLSSVPSRQKTSTVTRKAPTGPCGG